MKMLKITGVIKDGVTILALLKLRGCFKTLNIKRQAPQGSGDTAQQAPQGSGDTTPQPPAKSNTTSKSSRPKDVPGIPFFVKSAVCKQETTWLQPVYVVTLTMTTYFKAPPGAAGEKPSPPPPQVSVQTMILSRSQLNDEKFANR